MAIIPAPKCFRANIVVPQHVAQALGSTSTTIPFAAWVGTTPMGKQQYAALSINGEWQEISKPTPGVLVGDGKTWDRSMWPSVVNDIKTMGAKEWAMREFAKWVTDLLKAFFAPLFASSGNQPAPTPEVVTSENWDVVINGVLADNFILDDRNGDGIPEMYAR